MKSSNKLSRPLILATASEARRKLISDLGIKFIMDTVEIDESPLKDEKIRDYVERLAKEKADKVVPPSLDSLIITVDTAIGINDNIIGKPKDRKDAERIIKILSGNTHSVFSSIALRDMKTQFVETKTTETKVEFIEISEEIINWYLSTGEWNNRAGAYAIQGKGMSLVKRIDGCLTNVIGISIPSFLELLSPVKY